MNAIDSFRPPACLTWRRDAKPVPTRSPVSRPPKEKQMLCHNEFFTGIATWRKTGGDSWTCIKASPSLDFLTGMNSKDAHVDLLRRGCQWEWISASPEAAGSVL